MSGTYTPAEISDAQDMLDLHEDHSPYWDTRKGQDHIEVIVDCNLVARHHCRCSGEVCPSGADCCTDDFPEPGDLREWA